MVNRNSITGQLVAAFLLGAAVVGLAVWTHQFWQVRTCDAKLTSPVLCKARQISPKREYAELDQQIAQFLQNKHNQGLLRYGSVYFRDLDSGPIFGINPQQEFVAASLLKVPVLMTFLKYTEDNPTLLKQVVHSPAEFDETQFVLPPKEVLQPDTDYTVEELLRRMIVYSDNRASMMLEDYAKANLSDVREPVLQTLVELGLLPRADSNNRYFASVKELASMLRVLYTVGYLSSEMSEYALNLLSKSDFHDGLVAGIPNGIKVAHKFGVTQDKDYIELHDIGIVYGPKNHYLIAVMTDGKDIEDNAKIIAEISRMVWEATQK
jgi:beta-lactamase class A